MSPAYAEAAIKSARMHALAECRSDQVAVCDLAAQGVPLALDAVDRAVRDGWEMAWESLPSVERYRLCGGPATGGTWFQPRGERAPVLVASDYELAMAIDSRPVAEEWIRRRPEPTRGKPWAERADVRAREILASSV